MENKRNVGKEKKNELDQKPLFRIEIAVFHFASPL